MPEIDTRFPAWMAERNWARSEGVTQSLIAGAQIAQRQQEFQATQELRASQLRSLEAYRATQINTQLMKQRLMEAEQTDAAKVTAWMRDPRQPPPEGLQTPKGLKAVADVQKAFADTEIGSKFAAVRKAYTEKIKDLDAVGALKVQQLLNVNQGEMTPEIAAVIDAETARIQGTTAGIQVLDELGEPYVKGGESKPAFLRSTKTGALHKLPQDWSETNPVVPLEVDGKIIGYGVRNASGGITQLREHKTEEPTLTPTQRGAMTAEFGIVKKWWDDLRIEDRRKPEMQAEMKRRLKDVQDRYTTTKRVRVKSPSGKIGNIPESQLQDALKQGYTPAE